MNRSVRERLIWIGLVVVAALVAWTAGSRQAGSGAGDDRATGAPAGAGAPAALHRADVATANAEASAAGSPGAVGVPVPADRSPAAIREFARKTLGEPHALTRYKMLIGLLNNLTPENWEEVVAEFEEQKETYGREITMEWYAFLMAAGEVGGRDATRKFYENGDLESCEVCLAGWAAADPEGAVEWLESEIDPGDRDRIWGAAVQGIAQTQPEIAINLLEQLPPGDRGRYTDNLMPIIIQAVGVPESTRLFEDMAQRAAANGDAGESYLRNMFGQLAWRRLAISRETNSTTDTAEWVRRHVTDPFANRNVVAQTAGQLSAENADEGLAWLDSMERFPAGSNAGPEEPVGYAAVVQALTQNSDLNTVGEWLNARRDHPHYGRLVIPHAGNVAAEDPQAAQVWVESITNPILRQRAVDEVRRRSGGGN